MKILGPYEWEDRLRWAKQMNNGDMFYYEDSVYPSPNKHWTFMYSKKADRNIYADNSIVEPFDAEKCDRCYRKSHSVALRDDGGWLCDRCWEVVSTEVG